MAFALYCWASFPGPPCGGEAVAVHVHPENILSRARVSAYFCRIASMLCVCHTQFCFCFCFNRGIKKRQLIQVVFSTDFSKHRSRLILRKAGEQVVNAATVPTRAASHPGSVARGVRSHRPGAGLPSPRSPSARRASKGRCRVEVLLRHGGRYNSKLPGMYYVQ